MAIVLRILASSKFGLAISQILEIKVKRKSMPRPANINSSNHKKNHKAVKIPIT